MSQSNLEIVTGAEPVQPQNVTIPLDLQPHLGPNVSISLRYYQKKAECWSEWKDKELKAFTKVIDLLREQTANQLMGRGRSGSPACIAHVGDVVTSGFVRPNISDDIAFYELHANDKARLHGFFVRDIFFLVWLDRSHRAFPVK